MKIVLKTGIPLVLLAVVAFWAQQQLEVTVPVSEARTGTAVNAVTGTVEVWANIDITVKARHAGVIREHRVLAGEFVEKGQPLVIQDSDDLDLRIEQLKIRLEAARQRAEILNPRILDLKTIEEEVEGTRLAVELQQSPESALNRVERERDKTEIYLSLEGIQEQENIRLLESQLAQLELQKNHMTTVAPYAGRIASFSAFPGDWLYAGNGILRLLSHGRYIVMELTEEDYFGVEDGQQVTLRLASYPDRTFPGKVVRLEDAANTGTKTRNLIVTVNESDDVMVPGLTGEGYLVKGERTGNVLIPRRALIGDRVYVVEEGRVAIRRVQPGYLGLTKAEIVEGLEEGELVILEDQGLLSEGQKVSVSVLPFNP